MREKTRWRGDPITSKGVIVALLCLIMAAVAGCAATASQVVTTSHQTAASPGDGSSGRAMNLPGLPARRGEAVSVASVSCASQGNCAAGGSDGTGRSGSGGAFVASEVNGAWRTAHVIPRTMAIDSVSCAAPGDCAATGATRSGQAFVISEAQGTWGAVRTVRFPPGSGGRSQRLVLTSVSCGAVGNCSAGGAFTDTADRRQPFVLSEVHGAWGPPRELAGLAALNTGDDPTGTGVAAVSCASAGNCSAAGTYASGAFIAQAFVVSEVHGTWGAAITVPGSPTGSKAFGAVVPSVSCGSPGNCVAIENYQTTVSAPTRALVVPQVNGRWGRARPVVLAAGGSTELSAVSCASAGNCVVGGASGPHPAVHRQLFVASEVSGTWHRATRIFLPAATSKRDDIALTGLSCGSAGNCAAGGFYGYTGFGTVAHFQAFVAAEVAGKWGVAHQVPGIAALNKAFFAHVWSVSCAPAGSCLAGGDYSDNPQARKSHPFDVHAFVASER